MSEHVEFGLEVHQNPYLPEGGEEAEAIVRVTATEQGSGAGAAAAQVIVVDCSGSMSSPETKIEQARRATAAAIDTLRDDVHFAVVAGSREAKVVYPRSQELSTVTATTRAEAKEAVARLDPGGGTAIGEWLAQANRLLADHQDKICHAILLTDGKNEHETDEDLDAALAACAGRFSCDARGVGADWDPEELRKVTSELLGSWDLVREPAHLEADFRAMAQQAMRKAVTGVMLRLWTPRDATVPLFKQVEPTIEDVTSRRVEVDARSGDYPTGSWGRESRDYHVRVRVNPGDVGDEVLAARVSVVAHSPEDLDAEVLTQGLVRALWTADPALSSPIDPTVAHYTGQEELHEVIQRALQARDDGDMDAAGAWFRQALERGDELGRTDTVNLVQSVFNPATGAVRRDDEKEGDRLNAIELDRRSSKTTPLR